MALIPRLKAMVFIANVEFFMIFKKKGQNEL